MSQQFSLNALRAFEATARLGSFSEAASELFVTPSAVSHQLRGLEDWVGQELFERKGNRSRLTPRGETLARRLTDAFVIIDEACRDARAQTGAETLTVAVLPSLATLWLIPRLNDFYLQHPLITVKIVYLMPQMNVDFKEADLAMSWGKNLPGTMLLPGDTIAVASPNLLQRLGKMKKAKRLLDAPLLHDTDQKGWQTFMHNCGLQQTALQAGPVFPDFNLLRSAALAGLGLALCPRSLIEADIQQGLLVPLYENVSINSDYGYWTVEPMSRNRTNPALALFRAWLHQQAHMT